MANLQTTYLGIPLKNPIIVGASNLVSSIDNLKKIEDAGAAAIVYKTLFEEQIQLERLELDESRDEYSGRNAEMINLFPNMEHAGPGEHLINLRQAKESVNIPLIASLNCVYTDTWVEYAKKIQDTGVDALELNFYYVPRDLKTTSQEVIEQQIQVLKEILKSIEIPVSVKLSSFYANPLNVIEQMDNEGINGVVLFNRFLQPDIDIETLKYVNHFAPSNPEENKLPLRFSGLLFGNISASICANSGIYTSTDIAKMILAGADCVQIVSALYKNKIDYISELLMDLNKWMDSKGYKSLNDFKGILSNKNIHDPYIYKRAQYIDILLKSSEIFNKYKLH